MRIAKSALILAVFCITIAALSRSVTARTQQPPNDEISKGSFVGRGQGDIESTVFFPQPGPFPSTSRSIEFISGAPSIATDTNRDTTKTDDGWQVYLPLVMKCFYTERPGLWESEPNNDVQHADGPLPSSQEYFGYPNDQDDYFSIYVSISGQITVDLTNHADEGVQLQLFYQSVENMVGFDPIPPYHIEYTGPAGWYYIRIFTAPEQQNCTTPYTLQATFPTPTPTPTPTSTATSTPTPTPTGSATSTPTPTDTTTPTYTVTPPVTTWCCQSFRPPLSDSGHPGEFEIATPEHCANGLPYTGVEIAGTYTGIPPEDKEELEVWVLVYASDHKYYPQSDDACNGTPPSFGGGVWSVSGNLGREGVPECFDIVVVVTNRGSQASERFREYLTTGCPSNTYEGIPDCEMPTDLTEKARITVSTEALTPTVTPAPEPTPTWCRSFRPALPDRGHPGEFEIVTPADCADDVPHTVQIAGTYSGISEDDEENLETWVLAYPEDHKYYPQSSNACSECPAGFGGDVWVVTGHLGQEGRSETFDIVVVVTNRGSQASTRFKQYLRHGCDTGNYIGIPRSQMPTDLTEKASTRVRSRGS